MIEQKPQTWGNRLAKALLWILIPLGALVAKDVYDYGKSIVDSSKSKPAVESKSDAAKPIEPLKPVEPPKSIGSGVLLEKFKTLAPQASELRDKVDVKDVVVKAPIPLILAARNGQVGLVRLLLDRGADVNAKEKETQATALIVAAQQGHIQVVDALLQKGADVNAKDKAGQTALSEATRYNHEEVVKLLKKHSVNQ